MDANILGASIIGIAPKNVIKNIWQVSKKASNLHIQGRNQRDKAVVAAYLFLWIFQGFCKELYLIHHFDSAVCFVNIHCAHRGVPPLAARPSLEKFFIPVLMLENIVLCIQHLSL